MQGRVKDYDSLKGRGSIETESGDELYVHKSALQEDASRGLHPGDIVEFRQGRDRFGRRAALDVRCLGWEEDGLGEEEEDGTREWSF